MLQKLGPDQVKALCAGCICKAPNMCSDTALPEMILRPSLCSLPGLESAPQPCSKLGDAFRPAAAEVAVSEQRSVVTAISTSMDAR